MRRAPIDLGRCDPAGQIAEAADRCDRRAFLYGAGIGALGLAVPARLGAQDAGRADVAILDFALALEYLQSAFYTEAERLGALAGQAARTAAVIGAVERAHVTALQQVLADKASPRGFFDFQGATEDDDLFLATAVAFEDLGTAAYKQQLGAIRSPGYLAAAASIHSVEARHAAWIRFIAGVDPAADDLDDPLDDASVRALVADTGFVRARPATASRAAPRFTG